MNDEIKNQNQKKIKIKKLLPNAEVAFNKELEIFKGLVEFSNQGSKYIRSKEINIGISPSRISRELKFLESIQLAKSQPGGKYTPMDLCKEFVKYLKWKDYKKAKVILKNIFSNTWFGDFTKKFLEVKNSTTKDQLLKEIGIQCEADPIKDEKSLRRLIEWMIWTEILKEEKGKFSLISTKILPPKEITPTSKLANSEKIKIESPYSIQIVINIAPDTSKQELKNMIKIVKEALEDIE